MMQSWRTLRQVLACKYQSSDLTSLRAFHGQHYSLPVNPSFLACRRAYLSTESITNNQASSSSSKPSTNQQEQLQQYRLSKLLSQAENWTLSRREAERLIRSGELTLAGKVVDQPYLQISANQISSLRLQGKAVKISASTLLSSSAASSSSSSSSSSSVTPQTRVWLAHKLAGELVADFDPQNRPLLMQRLLRGGVGRIDKKHKQHIKAVGRLDVATEGLMVVTNDGAYARAMELPASALHRTYRVRVHGILHEYKLARIEKGMRIENVYYRGMKVQVDRPRQNKRNSTNQWITMTCTEGKNRQIRKVLEYLGLKVSRLIRISFGDYKLDTIPPGMAIEVPVKPVEKQKHRGPLWKTKPPSKQQTKQPPPPTQQHGATTPKEGEEEKARPIQWIRRF